MRNAHFGFDRYSGGSIVLFKLPHFPVTSFISILHFQVQALYLSIILESYYLHEKNVCFEVNPIFNVSGNNFFCDCSLCHGLYRPWITMQRNRTRGTVLPWNILSSRTRTGLGKL
ncbi:uncharacterized protein LOC122503854 [Leptopilina heterotoma]|uniref:uncharacterized protein LOC122503854 n=1 Tax=Leptopilina heterotoma TaxID=63436 RepID=UPI001CA94212|nr:uncharacterized protein LOC122503854 [Leptopilina heterotoma]